MYLHIMVSWENSVCINKGTGKTAFPCYLQVEEGKYRLFDNF